MNASTAFAPEPIFFFEAMSDPGGLDRRLGEDPIGAPRNAPRPKEITMENTAQNRSYDILHRVGIDGSAAKIFDALTTIEGLCAWWTPSKGNAKDGGRIDFTFCSMDVVATEPGKLVHWRCSGGPEEWVGTEVVFKLERKKDQTFVLFSHTGWRAQTEHMCHCSTKWGTFLLSLRDYIEQGAGKPVPNDLRIEVKERM
jgi:uncharacterized protein YndB with AHSA1/START domain